MATLAFLILKWPSYFHQIFTILPILRLIWAKTFSAPETIGLSIQLKITTRTLVLQCHEQTHTHGWKRLGSSQLEHKAAKTSGTWGTYLKFHFFRTRVHKITRSQLSYEETDLLKTFQSSSFAPRKLVRSVDRNVWFPLFSQVWGTHEEYVVLLNLMLFVCVVRWWVFTKVIF